MGTDKTFKERDKELQDKADKLREDGDLINRYITHEEVFQVAKIDHTLLRHQFVETFKRGLVRNHTKSIKKCLGIAKTMLPATSILVDQLEVAVDFLKDHKPSAGRKSRKVEVGTVKTATLNKRLHWGYYYFVIIIVFY